MIQKKRGCTVSAVLMSPAAEVTQTMAPPPFSETPVPTAELETNDPPEIVRSPPV